MIDKNKIKTETVGSDEVDNFEADAEYVFHHITGVPKDNAAGEMSYFDSQRLEDAEEFDDKLKMEDAYLSSTFADRGYEEEETLGMQEIGLALEGDEFY